ncbi:MAG TPA: hypothetical protein VEH84_16340 [Alphaproteobacteria bacterium]|nr:hypothetical protein [Alphaproteobacteria bacterium]
MTALDLDGAAAPDPLRRLRRGWWLVALGPLLGLALAALWLRLTPPLYVATMVVGPVPAPAPLDGLAGPGARLAAGRAGPLAGLIDEPDLAEYDRFLEMLAAPAAVARLEPELAAAAAGLRPGARDALAALLGRPGWQPPGPAEVSAGLGRSLEIAQIGHTPLRRIGFAHADRAVALALPARLHAAADAVLREQAERRGATRIAYLKQQIAQQPQQDHRGVLAALLAREEQAMMLAAAGGSFAAEAVQPPTAPLRPERPDPLFVLAVAAAAGLAAGLGAANLRGARR